MKYFISEAWYKLRNTFNDNKNALEVRSKLKDDGYFVYKNFLSTEKCNSLIELFNNNKDRENVWRDDLKSDTRIYGIDRVEGAFSDIFDNTLLRQISKSYISKELNKIVLCNHIIPKKNNKGSGGGWHRDTINRRQLKFIIYLSDATINNGCFQYIKGTQNVFEKYKINRLLKLPLSEYRYNDHNIDTLLDNDYKVLNIEGKSGDLIIVDTSGIHRGKPIIENERYAVTQYMWDSKIPKSIENLIVK